MLSSNSLCSTEWPWTPESPPCTSQVLGWRMGTTILGSLTHFTFILRHGHTQLLRIALNSQSFCLNLSSRGITGLCHQAWEHFVFNVYSFKTLCTKKFISEPSPFWHAFISSHRKALQLAWQSLSLPTRKVSVVCAEVRLMGENEESAFLARSPSRTVQEPCRHERIWKKASMVSRKMTWGWGTWNSRQFNGSLTERLLSVGKYAASDERFSCWVPNLVHWHQKERHTWNRLVSSTNSARQPGSVSTSLINIKGQCDSIF